MKRAIGSAHAALQDKIEVNGKNADPVYTYLKKATKTGASFLASAVRLTFSGAYVALQLKTHTD